MSSVESSHISHSKGTITLHLGPDAGNSSLPFWNHVIDSHHDHKSLVNQSQFVSESTGLPRAIFVDFKSNFQQSITNEYKNIDAGLLKTMAVESNSKLVNRINYDTSGKYSTNPLDSNYRIPFHWTNASHVWNLVLNYPNYKIGYNSNLNTTYSSLNQRSSTLTNSSVLQRPNIIAIPDNIGDSSNTLFGTFQQGVDCIKNNTLINSSINSGFGNIIDIDSHTSRSSSLLEALMEEKVRFFAEEMDTFSGFNTITSSHDGFAGMCSVLIQEIKDEYNKKDIVLFGIKPPTGDVVGNQKLYDINEALLFNSASEHCDLTIPINIPKWSQLSGNYVPTGNTAIDGIVKNWWNSTIRGINISYPNSIYSHLNDNLWSESPILWSQISSVIVSQFLRAQYDGISVDNLLSNPTFEYGLQISDCIKRCNSNDYTISSSSSLRNYSSVGIYGKTTGSEKLPFALPTILGNDRLKSLNTYDDLTSCMIPLFDIESCLIQEPSEFLNYKVDYGNFTHESAISKICSTICGDISSCNYIPEFNIKSKNCQKFTDYLYKSLIKQDPGSFRELNELKDSSYFRIGHDIGFRNQKSRYDLTDPENKLLIDSWRSLITLLNINSNNSSLHKDDKNIDSLYWINDQFTSRLTTSVNTANILYKSASLLNSSNIIKSLGIIADIDDAIEAKENLIRIAEAYR